MVYPVHAREIISDFQSYRGANLRPRTRQHQGIDITGEAGQPIIAIADGRVMAAESDTCWGPTVVVDHGFGFDGLPLIALYGHVDEMLVGPGDEITRGQLLARLGDNETIYRCIGGVRHLHLQLGRIPYTGEIGEHWGHSRWLEDGKDGVNPHLYWANGPGLVTCYDADRTYPAGTITYPIPCDGQ